MTQHPDLFAALAAPFVKDEVKIREPNGRRLHYITARTAMNRLDEVLGPENWWDEYLQGEKSVLCRLTVRLPDGQVLTKCDAGGYAGMTDSGDDDKSGFSDAFKRAAVKFGVARYLYRDGVPGFVRERVGPKAASRTSQDAQEGPQQPARAVPATRTTSGAARGVKGVPRTGKALYAWTMDRQAEGSDGLLDALNEYIKGSNYPDRMVDLSEGQVSDVYERACSLVEAWDSDE